MEGEEGGGEEYKRAVYIFSLSSQISADGEQFGVMGMERTMYVVLFILFVYFFDNIFFHSL